MPFLAKLENGQKSQGIPFEAHFGDFADAPAPPCAVRLSWKLFWELFRARQSPHVIFSSNGQRTAEVEHRQKRHFGLLRVLPVNFAQNQNTPKKAFLGTLEFIRCSKSIFQLILAQKHCSEVKLEHFLKKSFLRFWVLGSPRLGPSQAFVRKIFKIRCEKTFCQKYVF